MSVMTGGGIAGGLNHAIKQCAVMTAGGTAEGLNHAIKQ
jgi:6-phosphofructokinase